MRVAIAAVLCFALVFVASARLAERVSLGCPADTRAGRPHDPAFGKIL